MSIACHNLKSGILVTNKFVSCLPHVLSAGLGCQAEEQQQLMTMRVTDDLTNAVINDFLIDMNKLPALEKDVN